MEVQHVTLCSITVTSNRDGSGLFVAYHVCLCWQLSLQNSTAVTARAIGFWPKVQTLCKGTPTQYSTSAAVSDKRALILGCGYMSGPLIEYLAQNTDCELTIGKLPQVADTLGKSLSPELAQWFDWSWPVGVIFSSEYCLLSQWIVSFKCSNLLVHTQGGWNILTMCKSLRTCTL